MSDFNPDWPHGHVTRDGREVRVLCTDLARGGAAAIAAAVKYADRSEEVYVFQADGFARSDGIRSDLDIINRPARG